MVTWLRKKWIFFCRRPSSSVVRRPSSVSEILLAHIDQKGAQTDQKIDMLRGHLDSKIQRLDGKTDELKAAAAEDSKEIRTRHKTEPGIR